MDVKVFSLKWGQIMLVAKNVLLEWSIDTPLLIHKLFSLHSLIYLKLCTLKSNCIIGGDINLKFLKYQIDTHITDHVNSILSLGCISLINKPTRFSSSHQPSLLDYIYTDIVDDNTTTGIALYDISDHLPTFANFNVHPTVLKNTDQKFAV